jgi:hypothetical protein
MSARRLFSPVVPEARFHPNFALLSKQPGSEPTRLMMEEVFASMGAVDGNFIEQFQTTAFDARVFELFLHAYFSSIGAMIVRVADRPDFLISRDGTTVAVEATTSNPTQNLDTPPTPITGVNLKALLEEDAAARVERANNEIPIRFGSPLFTKLCKRYWELPHVKSHPLVFAIEGFHAHDALTFSSASLAQYLYGVRQTGQHDDEGRLLITTEPVDSHAVGSKQIPSNFFQQPHAEHVSGVLFTNAGSISKFTRMGYQAGLHRGNVIVSRHGVAWDPNPDAAEPQRFDYRLDEGPGEEPWGSGVEIFHNPNALHPLSDDFFLDALQTRLQDGRPVTWSPKFAPFASFTRRLYLGFDSLRPMSETPDGFGTILRRDFEDRSFVARPDFDALNVAVDEVAWFGERRNRVASVVLRWHGREEYDGVIFTPDAKGVWRHVDDVTSLTSLDEAAKEILDRMRRATHVPRGDIE